MNSDVLDQRHPSRTPPFGYISFRYDLTPHLKFDTENVISVTGGQHEQPNSGGIRDAVFTGMYGWPALIRCMLICGE
jgi:hypothetical protein